MKLTPEKIAELKAIADEIDNCDNEELFSLVTASTLANGVLDLIADLEEMESRFNECVGGFKRDLQKKLADQRRKNNRLTAELATVRKHLSQHVPGEQHRVETDTRAAAKVGEKK